ncbi:hypothetical protein BX616_001837 [Lobosporangium transversale]|nr:hypothetical protein BX616_001837 [Lobosporangium transversale]
MTTSEMEEQGNATAQHQHQQHQHQQQNDHNNSALNGDISGHSILLNGNGSTLKARRKTIKTVQFQIHDSQASPTPSSSSTEIIYKFSSSSSSPSLWATSSLIVLEGIVHILVLSLVLLHIWIAPYTKVEESFNLQAVHDILTFGVSPESVKQYDHLEFPGVVPRTFVGPLLLAACSWPIMILARLFTFASAAPKGLVGQIIGWYQVSRGIQYQFGKLTSILFMIVSGVQFHWLFYAGRTLPNTFALIVVNVAYSYWMQASSQKSRVFTEKCLFRMIDCFVLATVLFRSEILLLLGPIILLELIMARIQLISTILEGMKAGLASLAIAIVVDSWFWRQWMWAEGAVFWFNAVQGKSVAWGVSPWHTYFTSLVPKISGIALPLALVAVVIEPRFRRYMIPATVFVTAYSILEHKEWRFVVYTVPILNLGAAITLSWVLKQKTLAYRFLVVILFGILGLSFISSTVQSLISSFNYPGGQALQRLHELELPHFSAAMVHIDGAAAETGCSRFGELASSSSPIAPENPWTYSKNESHKKHQDYLHYTHLLTSIPEFHKHDYIVLEQINGFAGLTRTPLSKIKETCPATFKEISTNTERQALLSKDKVIRLWRECSPLQIMTEGKIWIMRRYGAV